MNMMNSENNDKMDDNHWLISSKALVYAPDSGDWLVHSDVRSHDILLLPRYNLAFEEATMAALQQFGIYSMIYLLLGIVCECNIGNWLCFHQIYS